MKQRVSLVFWTCSVSFLITGIGQQLLWNETDQTGAGTHIENGLGVFANYVGTVILCFFIPSIFYEIDARSIIYILPNAALDLAGNTFNNISVLKSGSGEFSVIYSMILVYNGLLQFALYGKRLSTVRWFAVVLITMSTFGSCVGQFSTSANGWDQAIGISAGLLSVLCNGANYVVLNARLRSPRAPKPMTACLITGIINSSILFCYGCIYTFPRWNELVWFPIQEKGNGSDVLWILFIFFLLVICNGVHQLSMYGFATTGPIAAVTAGVIKAITAACVFYVSAALYCQTQPAQCLNTKKVYATFGVVSGVLIYTFHNEFRRFLPRGLKRSKSYGEFPEPLYTRKSCPQTYGSLGPTLYDDESIKEFWGFSSHSSSFASDLTNTL